MRGRPTLLLIILGALLILVIGTGSALLLLGTRPAPARTGDNKQANRPGASPATTPGSDPAQAATSVAIAPGTAARRADTGTSTVTPTETQTPTITPTDTPYPTATPESAGGPVPVPNNHKGRRWVALQAGHWLSNQLPEELTHLADHTGASAGGVNEVDVNVAVAKLAAQRLYERGYSVEILNATVPPNYTTDLFIALHADGSEISGIRGFKAVAPWGAVATSDEFVNLLYEEYGKATGLPTDARTSAAMGDYYAFNSVKYHHAINPFVPAAILEMGFITNPLDRRTLAQQQDKLAMGIANAVDRYFHSGAAGPTPSPYPSFTRTVTATPTTTATSTPSSTPSPTVTLSPTAEPTEMWPMLTQTAAATTPMPPTRTATMPTATHTAIPTATPLTGTITIDGRWLAPMAPNGRSLPPPGSNAAPVLLGWADDDPHDNTLTRRPDWQPHVWWQYYVPRIGRSIWVEGEALDPKE